MPLPESWEEDKKMWVVEAPKEGEEAPEEAVAPEVPETVASLEAEEAQDAVEVYDEPVPSEAVVEAVDELVEVEPPQEPEPAPAMSDGGISLDAVEAALDSKSSKVNILDAEAADLEAKSEEDEFDLEKAMREAGLDPNAEE